LQDDEGESIETRIIELQRQYREVVDELRADRAELKATSKGLADCFQTAHEERVRGKQGNSLLDCFLELYRQVSALVVPENELSTIECQVRRMKREVDTLWEEHLMKAVTDIAQAIRIDAVRFNPDALADARQDILLRVYERTLLECLINWKREGHFSNYLRASVANVKLTQEGKLRKRIKNEPLLEERPESIGNPDDKMRDDSLAIQILLEKFAASRGGTREADVLSLRLDGMTHKEIAEQLDISENYSRQLLRRALHTLKELGLEELSGPDEENR